jgi:MFS family permease
VGALVAVPLGPWVEFRRRRRVMIAMDLIRAGALLGLVLAFAAGRLALWQLVVVTVVVAASDNAFRAASGAFLKELLRGDELLHANVRLESTTWTATLLGPPLGGAAIGAFGPVVTVAVNAVSYVASAVGLSSIHGERRARRSPVGGAGLPAAGLLDGWRHILASPTLRPLFVNTAVVNGLIMATAPLMAVLMLGRLGFAPWQYGLAFGAPCVGGLLGSRLARPLAVRFGRSRALRVAGTLRSCWSLGLVLVRPGPVGLLLVFVVQFGLVTCSGIFAPLYATLRLEQTPRTLVARTLSAWSTGSTLTIAACTALWGGLAAVVGPRPAVLAAGLLLLGTPLLLRVRAPAQSQQL